jgi:SAM-dependent methyltransferase
MTPERVGWRGLEGILRPSSLERAVARDPGAPTSFPILDFEPELPVTFYDRSPYDFSDLSEWRSSPMLESAVALLSPGGRRLDAGCGAGRNAPCLMRGTGDLVVVDLSLASVSRVASRLPVHAARASVLRLPFVDGSFELVACDGVAHHTPDPEGALREVVRVTSPGGWIYAAVYRAGTAYSYLYRYLGGVLRGARRLEERGLPPAVDRIAFAGYRAASRWLKPGRTGDEASLRSIYEDYFQTPIASFHERAWVESVLAGAGAAVERVEPHQNVWRILARKRGG